MWSEDVIDTHPEIFSEETLNIARTLREVVSESDYIKSTGHLKIYVDVFGKDLCWLHISVAGGYGSFKIRPNEITFTMVSGGSKETECYKEWLGQVAKRLGWNWDDNRKERSWA